MSQSVGLDQDGPADRAFEPLDEALLLSSVIDRFEVVARKFGDRLALDDGKRQESYGTLAQIVEATASLLTKTASGRDGPVAILLGHDLMFIAALLGVLRAGRSYLPLDASFPDARNHAIAEDANVAAIISMGEWRATAKQLVEKAVPLVDLGDLGSATPSGTLPRPKADDLAYILYTSGSTGEPKGVAFDHRNAIHDALQYVNACHIGEEDRLTLLYSPSVAGAVRDIYSALLTGAALHLIPTKRRHPKAIANEIVQRGCTVLHTVPVLFRRLLEASDDISFESVRIVYLAGDRVDWRDVANFRRRFPNNAHLLVAMGSTECATAHSQWFVRGDAMSLGPLVPVGRPLPDRVVELRAEDGVTAPIGTAGEIVVSSPYVARGYWNGRRLEPVGFEVDARDSSARVVRTGDYGIRRRDGLLETIGRQDRRIKLSGHRIELAEVEAHLRACPGVAEASIVARKAPDGTPKAIVGYVTFEENHQGQSPEHLRKTLVTQLAAHCVPSAIFVLEAFPMLANYKIDLRALARLDAERQEAKPSSPTSPTELSLCHAFERILQLSGVAPTDSFSALGGDSLQALELLADLEETLGLEIPEEIIGRNDSVRALADWIEANGHADQA